MTDLIEPGLDREAAEHGQKRGTIISLRNVRKTFTSSTGEVIEVLKGINLDIEAGSFNVIRGESGSGKTTLLRILGMLDSHFEGSYDFAGEDVQNRPDWYCDELRSINIGFIFQDGRLFNHLDVRENIALPVRLQGNLQARRSLFKTISTLAPKFFTSTELSQNILSGRPTQVSGGQKQRASILRAVINRPAIILADEPTASLDESRKTEVLNSLVELCSAGHTVIVVSHDKVFYDAGRQIELTRGSMREIAKGSATPVSNLEVRKPAEGGQILFGWRPRAPATILIRQALRETFFRPIFLLLILISLCVGVTQVGVFSSVIIGAQRYLEDAMTKGSRLNRLEFKPLLSDYTEQKRFSKEDEIRQWGNVSAIVPRRSTISTLMNYREGRGISYDVKMLQENDPEYRLLDFVAGGPFSPGADGLEAIIPVSTVPDLFADASGIAKGTQTYADFVGKPITLLQRKYAPSGQIVSWTPISLKVVGIVLYAEGGGPVMYMPQTTLNTFDRYIMDKAGNVNLPLSGSPWTDADRARFVSALPHDADHPPAPLLKGGDTWSDIAEVKRMADFPWQDKLQVYTTEIREIIPVFRQLSKLGYKPNSDIFDKNMKWVLDVQDLAWNIFLPLLLLIIIAVSLTVATNIFSSAKLRETELALWRILGMRRGDLVATQIISTVLTVLVGSILGLLIAGTVVNGARSFLAGENPNADFDRIFAPVTEFMVPLLLSALLIGLLSAIYPSVRTAHTDPAKVLQSQT